MLIEIEEPSDVLTIRQIMDAIRSPSDQLCDAMSSSLRLNTRLSEREMNRFALLLKFPKSKDTDQSRWLNWVRVNHDGEFTNKTVRSFRLGIRICKVSTWRDLVRFVADILYIEHREQFEEIVSWIHGDKRDYFSRSSRDLRDAHRIAKDLFVETNLAANNCVSLVTLLAEKFGYDSIEIDCS